MPSCSAPRAHTTTHHHPHTYPCLYRARICSRVHTPVCAWRCTPRPFDPPPSPAHARAQHTQPTHTHTHTTHTRTQGCSQSSARAFPSCSASTGDSHRRVRAARQPTPARAHVPRQQPTRVPHAHAPLSPSYPYHTYAHIHLHAHATPLAFRIRCALPPPPKDIHPSICPPARAGPGPTLGLFICPPIPHPNQQFEPRPPHARVPTHRGPSDPSQLSVRSSRPQPQVPGTSDAGRACSVHGGNLSHARLD